ncbi:MAG: ArsR family transcriptional regulator [Thermoplasmata archaeon]
MTTVFATLGFTPEKLLAAVAALPNVEKVVVYTAFSGKAKAKAERALKEVIGTLRKMGIESETEILRSPWDFLAALETLLRDLADQPKGEAVLNLTGGPKTMTVAAAMASVLLGVPLVYFPEEEEGVRAEAVHLPVLKLPYSQLLTGGQKRVLAEIERRGGSAKSAEISKALGIAPPSLDYHLGKLSGAGVLQVSTWKNDRRHRILEITPSGRLVTLANKYAEKLKKAPKE